VEAIAEDRDWAIWIARSHMLNFTGPICQVSGDSEQCYGGSDGIRTAGAGSIAIDAQGHLWIGGSGTLVEWQGKLIGESLLPGANAPDTNRGIDGVAVDAGGTVWAGVNRSGPGDGLLRFSIGRWSSYSTPGFTGANVRVRSLFVDRNDCLWVGTYNQGLYRIHGQTVDHLGRQDGLSGNSVYQIPQATRPNQRWIL